MYADRHFIPAATSQKSPEKVECPYPGTQN